ncbi:MAG: hypothetical protein LBB14_01265 [Puniceicoccales bacterium]|jgi:hypothetical protein|nr:hypothetical protein [Puniceicoccales bacterium]
MENGSFVRLRGAPFQIIRIRRRIEDLRQDVDELRGQRDRITTMASRGTGEGLDRLLVECIAESTGSLRRKIETIAEEIRLLREREEGLRRVNFSEQGSFAGALLDLRFQKEDLRQAQKRFLRACARKEGNGEKVPEDIKLLERILSKQGQAELRNAESTQRALQQKIDELEEKIEAQTREFARGDGGEVDFERVTPTQYLRLAANMGNNVFWAINDVTVAIPQLRANPEWVGVVNELWRTLWPRGNEDYDQGRAIAAIVNLHTLVADLLGAEGLDDGAEAALRRLEELVRALPGDMIALGLLGD